MPLRRGTEKGGLEIPRTGSLGCHLVGLEAWWHSIGVLHVHVQQPQPPAIATVSKPPGGSCPQSEPEACQCGKGAAAAFMLPEKVSNADAMTGYRMGFVCGNLKMATAATARPLDEQAVGCTRVPTTCRTRRRYSKHPKTREEERGSVRSEWRYGMHVQVGLRVAGTRGHQVRGGGCGFTPPPWLQRGHTC